MTNIVNQTEQRQVMLGRLAAGLVRSNIYPTLQEAYRAARLILLDAESITSITKLNAVTAQIRRTVTEIDTEGWSEVTKELESIALYDAAYYAGLVGTAASVKLSTPPDEKIIGYINKSMMSLTQGQKVDAGTWAQFTKAFASSHTDTLDSIVRNGYAQGQTVAQMATQMRQVTDGLLKVQAETLARTGVQHYAVQARQAMFADNTDSLAREYPIVTFDNRISDRCRWIGTKYAKGWSIGQSPIGYPPFHFQCRTAVIALPEGVELEGTRAAVGGQDTKAAAEAFEERQDKTDKKVKYRGRKDSNIFKPEQIKATTVYDDWLKRQPAFFVESTLGKTRAELFLSGKLSFSQFYDMAGRPLTLAQLRDLDRI
jgi:hypothetical protein